jgi:hypothetical protein
MLVCVDLAGRASRLKDQWAMAGANCLLHHLAQKQFLG